MARKRAIRQAFGAAGQYDDEAHVQREVAVRLARGITALPLPANPRILEIGCGTGFLTSAVRQHSLSGEWTVTDLSFNMVARCRDALVDVDDIRFLAMDGEQPCFGEGMRFDLICSSLAFQWFEELGESIERLTRLLAPGGHLAFATMAEGSFGEWRAACRIRGLSPSIPDYPSLPDLRALARQDMEAEVADFCIQPRFGSAHGFLRHLRAIGAHVPRPASRPLTPGALRQVMRAFEDGGAVATYHIACCTFRKGA